MKDEKEGHNDRPDAPSPDDATEALEQAIARADQEDYVLRLYVTGSTPRSTTAIENLKRICDERLKGRFELQIVDLYQQPLCAKEGQIVAAPTLIKELPLPVRRVLGDLSDEERVLAALDLRSKDKNGPDSAE